MASSMSDSTQEALLGTLSLTEWMSYGMLGQALVALVALQFVEAPYGRYSSRAWGPLIEARLAWFMQELPSLLIPLITATVLYQRLTDYSRLTNHILMGAFLLHYIHRCLIYPLVAIVNGRPNPLTTVLIAWLFCIYNGLLQSRYLLLDAVYPTDWLCRPAPMAGLFMFFAGMYINIQSDYTLRDLRKSVKDGRYQIPTGGFFDYVSGANFFGEIVEWVGFALSCGSLPSTAFAVFVVCNLGPRALHHHRWYKEKFEDYPPSRKAFIPFVL